MRERTEISSNAPTNTGYDAPPCYPCHHGETEDCEHPYGGPCIATRYGTIVADPPWRYDYKNGPGNAAPWRHRGAARYETMALDDIKAIDVAGLAAPGCHLYLWATMPLLREALQVVEAWGFEYTTMLMWLKPGPGAGRGWRGNVEPLIVARQGRPTLPFTARSDEGSWFEHDAAIASRGEHSAKPELFMDRIEEMSPGPRLEMFSRRARMGWDTWGNQSLMGGAA